MYTSMSEWVSPGHPDRVADELASIVIEDIVRKDKGCGHGAIEVLLMHDSVVFSGEATTTLKINKKYLKGVVSKGFNLCGYPNTIRKFWNKKQVAIAKDIKIINKIYAQSPDIARATTDLGEKSGWNDQGCMWSSSEVGERRIGCAMQIATDIGEFLFNLAVESLKPEKMIKLGSDIKVQVSANVESDGFTLDKVRAITIAIPHTSNVSIVSIRKFIQDKVIEKFGEKYGLTKELDWVINGTGKFTVFGCVSDTSLTGRKISVNHPSAGPVWANKMIGGGCIPEGELVATPTGCLPIESINTGDKVLVRGAQYSVKNSVYSGIKPVYRIVTEDGFEFRASDEHNVKVATIDNVGFKPVSELNVGDILCIESKGSFGDTIIPNSYVLGAVLGDGYYSEKRKAITLYYPKFDTDSTLVKEFDKVFSGCSKGEIKKDGYETECFSRTKKEHFLIVQQFLDLGLKGCGARNKEIPNKYLTVADRESVAELLRGLFDTDGCISFIHGHQDSVRIGYVSVSKKLVLDIQQLLLKFGIYSVVKKRDTSKQSSKVGEHIIKGCGTVYTLTIKGKESLDLFVKEIGFKLERKNKRISDLKWQEADRTRVYGIRECLSQEYTKGELKAFLTAKRFDTVRKLITGGASSKNGYAFARSKIRAIESEYSSLTKEMSVALCYYYSPIKKIVFEGYYDCFDIEVEGVNEYVVKGISVHNSLVKPYNHASDFLLNVAARFIANCVVESGISKYAIVGLGSSIGCRGLQSFNIVGDKQFELKKNSLKKQAVESYLLTAIDWSPKGIVDLLGLYDSSFYYSRTVFFNFFGHSEQSQPWEEKDRTAPFAKKIKQIYQKEKLFK